MPTPLWSFAPASIDLLAWDLNLEGLAAELKSSWHKLTALPNINLILARRYQPHKMREVLDWEAFDRGFVYSWRRYWRVNGHQGNLRKELQVRSSTFTNLLHLPKLRTIGCQKSPSQTSTAFYPPSPTLAGLYDSHARVGSDHDIKAVLEFKGLCVATRAVPARHPPRYHLPDGF